ncbi:MAG: chemotaxis protein CheA [Planctomycetia bacterium]|nr:chemotaxis protein CheA [Planctomycetia bacterium]
MHGSSGTAGRACGLLEQLGLELAFASAGAPAPPAIGDALAQLEAACAAAPGPIRQALAACRHWLTRDAARGPLSAETLRAINDWQPWMVAACLAWDRGQSLAAMPAEWAADATATERSSGVRTGGETVPAGETIDVMVLPEGFDDEMTELFCAESQDLLQEVEQGVLALERNPADSASIDVVFRVFHTFKGNAGVLKLVVLQRLTHELESVLDAARRGKLTLGRDAIDLILAGADVLRRYVGEVLAQLSGHDRGRSIPLPVPELIARVQRLLSDRSPAPAAAAKPVAVVPPPSPARSPAPPAPAPVPPSPSIPTASVPLVSPPAELPAPATAAPSSVRVDTLKLDGLIDLVGELVVAQSMVVQSPELAAVGSQQLSRCLGQLRGITSDLQRTAMSLRMVPIGGTFRRMARLVRDLAVELDKEIDLKLEGEETELDRTLVEELADPLVHMIRNSADHGIEPPAARVAAGKPATGTITLRAFHQGGFIVIKIEDDGRGLSPDRIRAKAVERGLVQPDERLERTEILDLIFRPGFSTAEQITGLSGRGVGMDVVRRGIEGIRGKVEVTSVEGRGTTFTLSVPLTLAIIEGLIVGVGDQRYIVPTLSVRESFRLTPGAVTTIQGRGEVVEVRGRLTPILRLGRFLGDAGPGAPAAGAEGIVVVVESGQDCRCLLVDDLLGKQEVVIKSLGDMFRGRTAFAGAAILGDGRVGLILDVNALVKLKSAAGDAA